MSRLADDASQFLAEDGSPLKASDVSPLERVVQAWFKATLHKDKPATMALFNERSMVEIPFNESGRTEEGAFRRYTGMEELEAFTQRSHDAEGTMGFSDIENFVVGGKSTVFVEGRGNIVMSSGRDYRNRYVFKFDIDGDKIVKLREYYNPITSGLAFGRKIGPA